jgi:eukaryotic-like serine/threonine-protein kinase
MLSTHWEEVKSVFEAALLQDERLREDFVARRCGDDHELAQAVFRLLEADRESSKFLEGAPLSSAVRFSLLTGTELLATGDVLCGRFRILAYLGEGGMGQVYKAEDLELRQTIAIKAIRPEIADAPGVLSRFKREVNATRQVTHPNVCRTFDLETHTPAPDETGSLRSPITFLTMELLVGETLAERIDRLGPLPSAQVRSLATQIARALGAAHVAGVVHCDLKPSNIFLSGPENDPRILVTDFGIAKFIRSPDGCSPSPTTVSALAGSGAVGTPIYMSPEQFETGECAPASDLYSFGLVLYEALTAQKLSPYRRSRSEIESHMHDLTNIPGADQKIDPVWIDVIARCVEPNPADRFRSVQEVLDILPDGGGRGQTGTRFTRRKENRPGHTVARGWTAIPWKLRAFVLSALIVASAILIWRFQPAMFHVGVNQAKAGSSVAVLPVLNAGNDPKLRALAEGITATLTNNLAQVSGLRVPSQSAVRDLGNEPDVNLIRRKLNVDAVVDGAIVNSGENSKLQMELVDARTGFQLWGQSYTRKEMEDPSLADDVAQEVTYQLRAHSGSIHKRVHQPSSIPAAEAAFVQGRNALAEHSYAGFERSVKFFQQAIDADPNYAEAMAQLSRSYTLMAINNARPEPPLALMDQAESAARQALRIDSTLAAAYTSLAQVELLRDYNWSAAEEDFKRAEEVEPAYIPAHIAHALHLLTAKGRFAEARAQLTYADAETPKTLGTSLTGALIAYFSRNYAGSLSQVEEIRREFHTSAVAVEFEALNYLALNAPDKALKVLVQAPPDPSAPPELRAALRGIALAQMGRRGSALAELKKIEASDRNFESSYYTAALCARLGDKDKAFAYLEKSQQDKNTSMLFLAVDPLMDPLRTDPRFKSLLSTLNLL